MRLVLIVPLYLKLNVYINKENWVMQNNEY